MIKMNLATILTIAFIILKLTDAIDWSWWWVFSPLWITASLVLIFTVVWSLCISLFAFLNMEKHKSNNNEEDEYYEQ